MSILLVIFTTQMENKKERYYEYLVENLNVSKRALFQDLKANVIDNYEYYDKSKKIDHKFDSMYHNFIANNNIIITTEEIAIDLGKNINYN